MNHRTALWTLVLLGSVTAAHGQTPGNIFQATLGESPIHSKHAVQHERVEVDVEIEGTAETLNDHHGAASAVDDAMSSGATAQEPQYCPNRDAGHVPTQRVIPRQQIPQPMWQAQHPLSNRYVRKHAINEMRGPLRLESPDVVEIR